MFPHCLGHFYHIIANDTRTPKRIIKYPQLTKQPDLISLIFGLVDFEEATAGLELPPPPIP